MASGIPQENPTIGPRPGVWERYRARFGEGPPMLAWSGSQDGIEAQMERALAGGRRLTVAVLDAIQGRAPVPPGADW